LVALTAGESLVAKLKWCLPTDFRMFIFFSGSMKELILGKNMIRDTFNANLLAV